MTARLFVRVEMTTSPNSSKRNGATWFFLGAFVLACFLFWWLPSALFGLMGMDDPVHGWALWMSLLGLATFIAGYVVPPSRFHVHVASDRLLNLGEDFAFKVTVAVAVPALFLGMLFAHSRSGVDYGTGEGIPLLYQAILYTHLFFGFMHLGVARPEARGWRRIIITAILVTVPRLIISLYWGRFFLGQAVIPIVLIGLARGWFRLTAKRLGQLALLAMFVLFVPSLTRGDKVMGQDEIVRFFVAGSSLQLFQDNAELDLSGRCPPLLVSLTAKVVPYNLLGICTIDLWGQKGLPATLGRLLSYNDPTIDGTLMGTGSNFLLELYVSGGTVAIILGSMLFGLSCRNFTHWMGARSLLSGIWAECLTRALFAPRGDLGYVYERIPGLVLVTLGVVLFLWTTLMASDAARDTGRALNHALR